MEKHLQHSGHIYVGVGWKECVCMNVHLSSGKNAYVNVRDLLCVRARKNMYVKVCDLLCVPMCTRETEIRCM